ncbi:synapse differentiation-inducing gene protein 1-like [Bufo bufo]|uniref:synapse differentiation-inducing gene protein 1-like n=1 Tax=Bufo bufo TaxID=8384 RepID=UPI001ABE1F05|nr:synapse differentiation-inducing gene protein 1-like [Bufo bufo]
MNPPPSYTSNGFQDKADNFGFINQVPPPPSYYTPTGPTVAEPGAYPPVVTTSQYVVAMPQPAHRDYMGLSMLNIFLCCFPLGIIALLFSSKSRDSLRRGDTRQAAEYSATALRLNIAGIVIGCCGNIAWIAYIIYHYTTSKNLYSNNLYG